MKTIHVLYGSTTGNTKQAAQQIAALLNGRAIPIRDAQPADFNVDLIILGTSTWGIGDLQDDWSSELGKLKTAPLHGRTVALFGLGDQCAFSSSYLDGLGTLYDAVVAGGAHVIGAWPIEGYRHSESKAVRNGAFVGLALDDDNEAALTPQRIAAWCDALRVL
jgi:flavodoxin I